MLRNFGFFNLVVGLFTCKKMCFEIVNDDCNNFILKETLV